MADVAFVVKVGDRTFTLDRITFGDWRMLKTHFGLDATDILIEVPDGNGGAVATFNMADPNVLVGLMVAALSHERPNEQVPDLIREVEALDIDGLQFPEDEEAEPDPTPAGNGTDESARSRKTGNQGKTRKTSGKGT